VFITMREVGTMRAAGTGMLCACTRPLYDSWRMSYAAVGLIQVWASLAANAPCQLRVSTAQAVSYGCVFAADCF
jgi:hypothetical protein